MYSNICVLKIYCRGPHPDLITKLILITVLYCRGPPHMGLRDYGGLRTGGGETEGLQALGRLNAPVLAGASNH